MSGGKPVAVICGLLFHRQKILIARRKTGRMKGYWEFPGGKLEPGEKPEEALVREFEEEFQVTVHPGSYYMTTQDDNGYVAIRLEAYLCTYDGGPLTLLEHDDFKWVRCLDLVCHKLCPADIPIARKLIQDQPI